MKLTIKHLRQKGYKVRVMHTRDTKTVQKFSGPIQEVSNFGGSTKIELTTPDMEVTVAGEAVCSEEDNFNRRFGNEIALGRAISNLKKLTGDKYKF